MLGVIDREICEYQVLKQMSAVSWATPRIKCLDLVCYLGQSSELQQA